MSSRDGSIATCCGTLAAPGAWLAGPESRVGSFSCTSRGVSWVLVSDCAAAEGTGSTVAIDAFALLRTSRVASDEYQAKPTATAEAASVAIRIFEAIEKRLGSRNC